MIDFCQNFDFSWEIKKKALVFLRFRQKDCTITHYATNRHDVVFLKSGGEINILLEKNREFTHSISKNIDHCLKSLEKSTFCHFAVK